jgi:hypothetical protein
MSQSATSLNSRTLPKPTTAPFRDDRSVAR